MALAKDAQAIISHIVSGHRVFVHGGAATPNVLLKALVADAKRLHNVELIHLHTIGDALYAESEFAGIFKVTNLFVGPNMRRKMGFDNIDYLPCFLSEIPALFRSGHRALDVAIIHVSPPDEHGYCTLGTSVDVAKAAVESANLVLAQVNRQMPRVHGDGFIHIGKINYFIEVDEALPEEKSKKLSDVEMSIGRNVAELIENGSTLQVGIGSIPDAVLASLKNHRHLGVHTEMWSDGILALLNCGAIDNSQKKVHPGKTVSSFVTGSRALYDYIHDNPSVVQLDAAYVNDPNNIARNPKVVAINSAVEVDLTGQVCADSVGSRIISGVGGQMDFIRGATLSKGGVPMIAITSRSKKAGSRIVPVLKSGAGVVTTRAHVRFIATEFGIADLYGKTLGERSKALIAIAHPDDREGLERAWHEQKKSN
jgi:4-hydroxybutyrate CoA-transferase